MAGMLAGKLAALKYDCTYTSGPYTWGASSKRLAGMFKGVHSRGSRLPPQKCPPLLEQLGATVYRGKAGQKFVFQMNDAEKAATQALQDRNLTVAMAQEADLLVLDEAGSAWELDMVDKDLLRRAVLQRPAGQECVLTAHAAPQWMLDAADYVTEMKCIRHPYQKGIAARKGVEY